MLRERLGKTVLREREIGGTMNLDRDWGNTLLRERLGRSVLRGRFGEQCAEIEIGGTLC